MNPSNQAPSRPQDLNSLKQSLIQHLSRELEANPPPPSQLREIISKRIEQLLADPRLQLSKTLRDQVLHDILDDLLGLGPIQPLLDDPEVNEVMVNGARKVYIERKGKLVRTNITFENDEVVLKLIDKIIMPLGRRIDADNPTVDARLPDGSRVNAVIPPVAIDGPTITIRKFQKGKLTIEELVHLGSITYNMAEFIRACVVSKLNVIIAGGTGSGKTTLLNVLSGFIPEDERIITIEDAAELRLQQEHVVRLESKPENIDGKGSVSIRELVRNSLRMRPDRIVVGEVRGSEGLDMLQAMNTGHDGSLTTIHANSPRDTISRLETLCMMAGMEIPLKVIREQIASAIDLIIQTSRLKDGKRKITAITEVAGLEGETVVLTDIFKFEQTNVLSDGTVVGELKPTGIRPLFSPRLEAGGFKLGPEVYGANLNNILNSNRRR